MHHRGKVMWVDGKNVRTLPIWAPQVKHFEVHITKSRKEQISDYIMVWLTNIVMIMMMTVMMMVFMAMNDRLSIMMIQVTVSTAAVLTGSMFTMFLMALWSWWGIATCKWLTSCMIRVCKVVCGKIQVLRTATQTTAHFTTVSLTDTVTMLVFMPLVLFSGSMLILVISMRPLIDPLLYSGHVITVGWWWIALTRSSLHSLRIVIHSCWVNRIKCSPGSILQTILFYGLPLLTSPARGRSSVMHTTPAMRVRVCGFTQAALWSDLTKEVRRWGIHSHGAFSLNCSISSSLDFLRMLLWVISCQKALRSAHIWHISTPLLWEW